MTRIGHRALSAWLWAIGASAACLSTGCPSSASTPADAGTDPQRGVLQMGAATAAVLESTARVTVSVSRVGGTSGAVSVHLDTADGSAHAGDDYVPLSTTVSFADGEVGPKAIDITVANDTAAEGTETFLVTLSAPAGEAGLGTPVSTTVSILDDDGVRGFGLNDTGVTGCATASASGLPCDSPSSGTDAFPGQDGMTGRDVDLADDTDGHGGFSFVKLDATGAPLPDQSVPYATTPWACVADRVTSLTWEVRTTDGGLRDRRWRYTWFAATGLRAGAGKGVPNAGTCVDALSCDTEKYVAAVNAARLCGHDDWRLPTRAELLSLVDYGAPAAPLVDQGFFPDASSDSWWTGTTDWFGDAWVVELASGHSLATRPERPLRVRLVRGGF